MSNIIEDNSKIQKSIIKKYLSQITKTDKEIDAMVYELYDLTDEEIAIIENNLNNKHNGNRN